MQLSLARFLRVDDFDRNFLHVLVDESVAVFPGPAAERDTDVPDGEPEKLAVENAEQIEVVRAQAVSGIGNVGPGRVQGEAGPLGDIREDNLGPLEHLVVSHVVLDFVPPVLSWLPTSCGSGGAPGCEFWLPLCQMGLDRRVLVNVDPPSREDQPLVPLVEEPATDIFAAQK